MTRRDKLWLISQRGQKLNRDEASSAWRILMDLLEHLGEKDLPKFNDVSAAIRRSTISAKSVQREVAKARLQAPGCDE